jgi:hypothetical protein
MDHLRNQYTRQAPVTVSDARVPPKLDVYTHHVTNPVIYHHWAGYYPQDAHVRKVRLELEEAPAVIFQQAPRFHYQPHTSNVDVDLQ